MYRGKLPPTSKRFKKITMFGVYVSNEGGALFRPHVFGFADGGGRTRLEWREWLDEHWGKILRENILDHYETQFGGLWRAHTIFGWAANVNIRFANPVPSKARRKAKRKGR